VKTSELVELSDVNDIRELAELFAVVWGRPGSPPISADVMKALAHSGNYVVGAYQNGRLIAGLVGWLGGDPRHELHLHSHILGVLPDRESAGLGFEMKQHQRRWCLDRGVRVMEWTTDPLVRRNGYFNLTKLGARAPEYLVNVYGEMRDDINVGEESDRLLIRWRLDSPGAESAAAGRNEEPDIRALIEQGAEVVLAVGESSAPMLSADVQVGPSGPSGHLPMDGEDIPHLLLCQVPDDIVALRRVKPELARSWRLALRDSLTSALARGYEITGASRHGWYVLELLDS
jgi:predicted GNAT superfamily acetyltransferase